MITTSTIATSPKFSNNICIELWKEWEFNFPITPAAQEFVHPENAGYIEHWLLHLREDSKAIFRTAKFAEEACDWLLQEGTAEQESTTNAA